GHPLRRGRHKGLRLTAELCGSRVSDRMDREARPPALGAVFRQVHDEIRAVSERRLEVAIEVIPEEMEFRDRDEDHVPEPPRGGAPEGLFVVPGRELQQRLALIPARFILLGRHEKPHVGGKEVPGHGLSPVGACAQPLCVFPRYRMLVERIAMVAAGKISPRTAAPAGSPTPPPAAAPKPAPPASPAPPPT